MEKSILNRIYLFLKSKGFEVYFPAMHIGECKTKYVVVKALDETQLYNFSTRSTTYELLCYVPFNECSQIEDFVSSVEEAMKEMLQTTKINPTFSRTPLFYDETINGYVISTNYIAHRKIKR